MSGIIDWFKSIPENFKNFVIENQHNPIMWIIFFFAGVAIFLLTYSALHRNK